MVEISYLRFRHNTSLSLSPAIEVTVTLPLRMNNAFSLSASASPHYPFPYPPQPLDSLFSTCKFNIPWKQQKAMLSFRLPSNSTRRSTFLCAAAAPNLEAEESFKKTVEIDRLIDLLRDANPIQLQKLVVENILAFNPTFWIRLAARTDTCKSVDDKRDYEELATAIMTLVDRVVNDVGKKIESSTDILKGVLKPLVDDVGEIAWPPRDPNALTFMQKEIRQREQLGQLDEGFLAEVNAQLRQAKEDGDKPGLEAMLQKVLQLYASAVLSKRSYALKGEEVLNDEQFLETIIQAPEEEWNNILINGLTVGGGDISPEELYAVLKKRNERTLIRTEGGSYQQRILTEYLKGIETRAQEIVKVFQGKQQ